ncbi:MAG: translation elongation factor Ts [candidate division Zixibacteria bacterium]|jgi:elongation factor Ts|nr:translation elongation factor Ts [candidate division Zixibacteria bacterium]
MEITAKMVKELRDKTGAGMMDCKKVLAETDGDFDKAVTMLREKGIAKAASKAGRATSEGVIASYIHQGDKLGVMVEINCETDFVARTENFQKFARDVAMHVAASAPLCVRREEIDQDQLQKEREIYRHQAQNEGKPANIIDKIVDGKVEKYFAEVVLLEQPFIKDPDKTVGDLVKETIGSLGENIIVKRFVRFALGE